MAQALFHSVAMCGKDAVRTALKNRVENGDAVEKIVDKISELVEIRIEFELGNGLTPSNLIKIIRDGLGGELIDALRILVTPLLEDVIANHNAQHIAGMIITAVSAYLYLDIMPYVQRKADSLKAWGDTCIANREP